MSAGEARPTEGPVVPGFAGGTEPVPAGWRADLAGQPRIARAYFRSWRAVFGFTRAGRRAVSVFTRALNMAITGFWLGALSREQLQAIGEAYYHAERSYWTDEYNKGGLFEWERRAIESHFQGSKRLLVMAAGGGREVLALRRLGFEVDGFESEPGLVAYANGLLEREGMVGDVRVSPWDRGPRVEATYDGVIVGWGAYMLIRGRDRRIAFLRELRKKLGQGGPILLSFYTTPKDTRFFRGIARIGNLVSRFLKHERIQVGDCLAPNYAHFFTRERLEGELVEAGFEPVAFTDLEYGHAVARVR